jgi:membrane protein YqaA with SNARE-associated domain
MRKQKFILRVQALMQATTLNWWYLPLCAGLAFAGTLTALYPVTAIVIPAVLLMPQRWLKIAVLTALSSALGATVLVLVVHHIGWNFIADHFPQLGSDERWISTMQFISEYGNAALFVVAATPLPQTPALIFIGIGEHQYLEVFACIFLGKILKYGVFAWASKHFPERIKRWSGRFLGTRL